MTLSLVDEWQERGIYVLGDVMLDRFVYGEVRRISPEAPIPVLRYERERAMLGGAGNVARNIAALGGRAVLGGVLGKDETGDLVAAGLEDGAGIETHYVRTGSVPTTVKTRFVSEGHQIMRLDVESRLEPDAALLEALVEASLAAVSGCRAVVLSDYAKGVLSPALIRRVIDAARERGAPVVVDPKTRDVARYRGASVITPNVSEAAMICGVECRDDASAEEAVKRIRELAGVDAVVLTRGAQGMTVWDPAAESGGPVHLPTAARDVFDVSGAGDTVVATLALALTAGASVELAARAANTAAGIAADKQGTAVVQARELRAALGEVAAGGHPKIVTGENAAATVADWKAHGLTVGFTNGCFDLIHPGHIELLRRARAACDRLVVALNTDASVKRLKGEGRPVQNETARSIVMAAIDSVDLVTLFDEDTPMALIELLKPDRLIKGADYSIETVVGAGFVQSYGGKVVLVPLQQGHSTSSLIAQANAKVSA